MAKKLRSANRTKNKSFDPESNRWFTPAAFLFFFIGLVILFSDFVFSDRMLHGSDTLNAGYTFRMFYIEFLRAWSIPQWTPNVFGGMPYVEAFHGDIFYPLSWPFKFFLPLKRALGWGLFWHILLAGWGMYSAARQFKLSKVASLTAAASYMFAGYLISLVAPGHDGKIFAASLYPFAILCLDRAFETKPLKYFSLLGLVLGLMLLSPHIQIVYFAGWSLAAYTIFKMVVLFRDKVSLGRVAGFGSGAVYAVILAVALSAIQILPGLTYTTEFSPRADSKKGWDWATSWSLHEEEAMGMLIPEFAGASTATANTQYWGKNVFKDNAETVGVIPIFLALLALFFYRRREVWFFGGLSLFAFLYALGATTPIFYLFYWLIPKVDSLRAPSMIIFMFSFSVALLAGMAVQRIIAAVRERQLFSDRFNYLLFGFPGFMFLLAIAFSASGRNMLNMWTSVFYSEASTQVVARGITKFDLAMANLPAIQTGAWYAFLFSAIVAGAIWLYRSGKAGTSILVLLVALPVVDGVRFGGRFVRTVKESEFKAMFEPNPLSKFFTDQDDIFRMVNIGNPNDNSLPFFGVQDVVGYHGNQLRWYDQLLGGPDITHIRRRPNARVLNLTGAKYLMCPTQMRPLLGDFGPAGLQTLADNGQTQIIKNNNALPRVFLVDQYRIFDDNQSAATEVISGTADLSRVVLLEEEPKLTITTDTLSTDSAWIIDYQAEEVTVGIAAAANRLLVLTDNYFDAWQVNIDGNPAELLRADAAFRAVAVPAGAELVRFTYRSERYLTGRLVTWLTCLYLIGILAFTLIRDRRKTVAVEPTIEDEEHS